MVGDIQAQEHSHPMKISKTRLYLIRHGAVEDADSHRFYGVTDVPLSHIGKQQIKKLGSWLSNKRIDRIYSSTLSRAVETAHIIAGYLNKKVEITSIKGLCEGNFGQWEGLTTAEVQKQYPEDYQKWIKNYASFKIPCGESLYLFQKRIMTELKALLSTNKNKHILIASHAGVNRIILCWALGTDVVNFYRLEQNYGCLNIIDIFGEFTVVKLINMTFDDSTKTLYQTK